MIEVVIFDLDGLLIDSQPLQYEAYNRVFSEYGYPISHEDWQLIVTQSYSIKQWVVERGIPLDSEMIRNRKRDIYERLIRDELQLKPGAKKTIGLLSTKYQLCIASSSRIESVKICLEKFSLINHFKVMISDTTMVRGKPFPDIFLEAASQMKTLPNRCVVIEDSVAGLHAAKDAGMRCIICPDSYIGTPLKQYNGADLIINSLEDISIETIDKLDIGLPPTK